MNQNLTQNRQAFFAATLLLLAGANPGRAATIPLHADVTLEHGVSKKTVAESGPTPTYWFDPVYHALPPAIATPNDLLSLYATTPDLIFSDTGWQATSTLLVAGNEIFWTISTGPSDDLFVGDALTPMEHSVELGTLPAGDYVLRTMWVDTFRPEPNLAPNGSAVTRFSVVPEPSTAALMLGIVSILLGIRSRRRPMG